MYINAGIKSKDEAVKRLIAGEVFYKDNHKIYYDPTFIASPFRLHLGEDNTALEGLWDYFKLWQIRVEWYDHLGDGILCYVWDEDGQYREIDIVVKYVKDSQYPYETRRSSWEFAEPLTLEEVKQYVMA